MYQSDISNGRWIAYDILGNLGWISYYAAYGMTVKQGLYFGAPVDAVFFFAKSIVVLGILAAIIELISERIQKLDRVLPKIRLYRGFGVLTVSGAIGFLLGLAEMIMRGCEVSVVLSTVGGLLCGCFSYLLFAKYKKCQE